jgi:hypothetical protein
MSSSALRLATSVLVAVALFAARNADARLYTGLAFARSKVFRGQRQAIKLGWRQNVAVERVDNYFNVRRSIYGIRGDQGYGHVETGRVVGEEGTAAGGYKLTVEFGGRDHVADKNLLLGEVLVSHDLPREGVTLTGMASNATFEFRRDGSLVVESTTKGRLQVNRKALGLVPWLLLRRNVEITARSEMEPYQDQR